MCLRICGRFKDILVPPMRSFGNRNVIVVSPVNPAGQMSGGIDRIYRVNMPGIEQTVQRAIVKSASVTHHGRPHLPVGSALLVRRETGPDIACESHDATSRRQCITIS